MLWYNNLTHPYHCLFVQLQTLSLSLNFSFFHTHIYSLLWLDVSHSCIVSFKWVIEEQYAHHWYTVSSTQQSPGKWQAIHEERRQFVLSVCACLLVCGCERRGWNVLCSNMLYFPTVTRTESLSLSLFFQLTLLPSILSGACGLIKKTNQVQWQIRWRERGKKRSS